jgi:hypothetical protein
MHPGLIQAFTDLHLLARRPPEEPAASLSDEDERLLDHLRGSLAALALADGAGGDPDGGLRVALDGSQLVARGEILVGARRRLPGLLPSFAFLVVLPHRGRDAALALADQASRLLVAQGDGERPGAFVTRSASQ